MLLNAANVVTAAERCHAIDEKTGRIPINFLLSRSNDLDDDVKDQLQRLAVQSPSISIRSNAPAPMQDTTIPQPPSSFHSNDVVMNDAVMTDVQPSHHPISINPSNNFQQQLLLQQQQQQQHQQRQQQQQHPLDPMDSNHTYSQFDHHHQHDRDNDHVDDDDDGDDDDDDEEGDGDDDGGDEEEDDLCPQPAVHHTESLISLQEHPNQAEEEALKDIDRETHGIRPDRKALRRQQRKSEQTLTRKAIRKHAGGRKGPKELSLLAKDSGSTINTVSASSVVQSSQGSANNTPRRRWKDWEDQLLITVVEEHGPTRWNSLAHHFPGRNGRQVRLRWMNHLQPSLNKRPWKPEEDAVLLEAHNALGNKWAMISMRLGGRTDNSVKNRYKSIARRTAREAKARRNQQE